MMVLRLSSARTALPPPPSASLLLLPRDMGRLPPVFAGLKIQQYSKRSTAGQLTLFSTPGKSFRVPCHHIVCQAQAQDTTPEIDTIASVSDASWESVVLKAQGPVVVEFWAPWCGPCRMLHPVMGELANEYSGRLQCFKLNTDDSPSIATEYGVRGVPTIIIFSNGHKKHTLIGALPKTTIAKTFDQILS